MSITIEPYPVKKYAEEYQVTGFHYSFTSEPRAGVGKMCHHWVKCRDFLQDALRNQLTGRSDSIYGFCYKPGKDPKIDTRRTRMLVKRLPHPKNEKESADFRAMMIAALALINHYEKAHKLAPSSKLVVVEDNKENIHYFYGPGAWSQSPVMIAIYTFLIRLGYFKPSFKNKEELQKEYSRIMKEAKETNDIRYLKTVYKNLDLAIKHRKEHSFKISGSKKILFHNTPISSFHHNSGIVSLSQLRTPEKKLNDKFREIFKNA